MIAAKQLQRDTRFTAIALTDYMKLEVPPTEYLVDGLVVEGSAVLFAAREKAGKGLIALDMLVSIVTGTPFLDRVVKEGPAIYVALEENIGTLKSRLHARWPSHDDIPLYIVQLDGSLDNDEEFYIDTVEGVDGLAELIEVIQPVVVVIDTLREAHRGRENESDDMAPRLKAIRALAHKTNTALVVTHHAAKMSGGARGSTAIRAAFDDFLEFTREDNESETDIRGVFHAEGRNLPKVVEHIAFNSSTFRWDVTSAPSVIQTPNLRRKILDLLHQSDDWLDAQGITEALPGTALGSVQNQLGRMMQERPRPFAVDPVKPKKGSPRKYHGIHPRDIPHHDAQTNDVTNEERPENVRAFPRGMSIDEAEAF
jgi:hypothetical protein